MNLTHPSCKGRSDCFRASLSETICNTSHISFHFPLFSLTFFNRDAQNHSRRPFSKRSQILIAFHYIFHRSRSPSSKGTLRPSLSVPFQNHLKSFLLLFPISIVLTHAFRKGRSDPLRASLLHHTSYRPRYCERKLTYLSFYSQTEQLQYEAIMERTMAAADRLDELDAEREKEVST